MKNLVLFLVIALSLEHSRPLSGQQHVEPLMIEVPKATLQFKINDTNRKYTVYDFYINQFPESVKQYKAYLHVLDSLGLDEKFKDAYPISKNLELSGLNRKEISFILNEYYRSSLYDDYPIVGLDYDQIQEYLEWKSGMIGLKSLLINGIENSDALSYHDFVMKHKDSLDIPLQVEFLIPPEAQLVLAFSNRKKNAQLYSTENKHKLSGQTKNRILKRLRLNDIYHYNLVGKKPYRKLDEAITKRPPFLSKSKIYYASELEVIHSRRKMKFKTVSESVFLKPWRTWHIKI